ncbi:FAD/NAD(P)-binding protein [Alteromonas ponticola]|uniref:FAD/NAD(P)-binding protein n=1 Tax=Alteromonas aquimaris TaxID=2998417 RepID=A0ABT3PA30_9ALTE|nr:FAD/NAD(P)-binding protein [Alteromonas aquimaris]MCW8109564.1 FAD/NAD(P)-binding protein [Alteromonas aquimaris]
MGSISLHAAGQPKIAVIGAGPATVYLLYHLHMLALSDVELDIFEASSQVGCGHAFSHETSFPGLLSNLHPDDIPPLLLDFGEWNHTCGDHRNYPLLTVLPRALVGKFLEANFNALIEILWQRNVRVTVHLDNPVTRISESEKGCQLQTGGVWYIGYRAIVNNAGLTNSMSQSPYPLKPACLTGKSHYTIFGSSLTAVDSILTIAHLNGYFTDNSKQVIYSPHREYTIKVLSPSGVFPSLWYPSSHQARIMAFMKSKLPAKFEHFEALYEAVCEPAFAHYCPQVYKQIASMKFKQALAFLTNTSSQCDAKRKLQCELVAYSRAKHDQYWHWHWQEILDAFLSLVETLYANVAYAWHSEFKDFPHSLVAKALGALPLENAYKLWALLESEVLRVERGCFIPPSRSQDSSDTFTIDCRGISPPPLKQRTPRLPPLSEGSLTSHEHLYVGSPHQRSHHAALPGLDVCDRLNRQIASKLVKTFDSNTPHLSLMNIKNV